MDEWVKTLVTSSVVGGLVSWLVSFSTVSYKLEQELHSREREAGYEKLVEANTLFWQSVRTHAAAKDNPTLLQETRRQGRESDAAYIVARHKIAAFGDKRVVEALGDYWARYGGASASCGDTEKFRSDLRIYTALRQTMGAGGNVSDDQLARVMFLCSLK